MIYHFLFSLVSLQLTFQNSKPFNNRVPCSSFQDVYDHCIHRIKLNMNPPGSISGTIVASPSKQDPNYFYDWIRDSALVYNALNNLNDTKEYVKSTIIHQMVGDFGEPKFYIDGNKLMALVYEQLHYILLFKII
jgi:hypothetical protein